MKNQRQHKKRENPKKRNQGSAVVEMSMLTPVLFAIVYLSIFFFLFFIRSGNCMEELARYMYVKENDSNLERESMHINEHNNGNIKKIWVQEEGKIFEIQLELRGNKTDPVSMVRRWKIAVDTVSK